MKQKNVWQKYDSKKLKALEVFCEDYRNFRM